MDWDFFAVVWLGLALWCAGYAYVLSRPRVQAWYVPDYTIVTVILGFAWVDIAMAILAARGLLPWGAVWALLALELAAGAPIAIWQAAQRLDRERKRNGRRNGGAHE